MSVKGDRNAYARARRLLDLEASRAKGRAAYAKHAERRRSDARKRRDEDRDAARVYERAMYAKHAEQRVSDAKAYREKNKAEVNGRAKEKYHANRDEINERRKGYESRPEIRLKHMAKNILAAQCGIPYRLVPDEMAEAKIAQLLASRAIGEAKGFRKNK